MNYALSLIFGIGLLDIIRRLTLIAWACVGVSVYKPLWRVANGVPLFYDVLWCTLGGISILMVLFGARAAYAPDSIMTYVGLYILSLMLAVSTIFVIRGYMRSHRASGRD